LARALFEAAAAKRSPAANIPADNEIPDDALEPLG
jgi:hypothetical protein